MYREWQQGSRDNMPSHAYTHTTHTYVIQTQQHATQYTFYTCINTCVSVIKPMRCFFGGYHFKNERERDFCQIICRKDTYFFPYHSFLHTCKSGHAYFLEIFYPAVCCTSSSSKPSDNLVSSDVIKLCVKMSSISQ